MSAANPPSTTHGAPGQVVLIDGVQWRIVSVTPNLTPYRKPNQGTRIESWTLGLVRA